MLRRHGRREATGPGAYHQEIELAAFLSHWI